MYLHLEKLKLNVQKFWRKLTDPTRKFLERLMEGFAWHVPGDEE